MKPLFTYLPAHPHANLSIIEIRTVSQSVSQSGRSTVHLRSRYTQIDTHDTNLFQSQKNANTNMGKMMAACSTPQTSIARNSVIRQSAWCSQGMSDAQYIPQPAIAPPTSSATFTTPNHYRRGERDIEGGGDIQYSRKRSIRRI
ncbi:hypothetical protein ACMFMG_001459 [Clarireedia jacksonii]